MRRAFGGLLSVLSASGLDCLPLPPPPPPPTGITEGTYDGILFVSITTTENGEVGEVIDGMAPLTKTFGSSGLLQITPGVDIQEGDTYNTPADSPSPTRQQTITSIQAAESLLVVDSDIIVTVSTFDTECTYTGTRTETYELVSDGSVSVSVSVDENHSGTGDCAGETKEVSSVGTLTRQ